MITFPCPTCHAEIRADDHAAGRSGTCPKCGGKTRVPGEPGPVPKPIAPGRAAAPPSEPLRVVVVDFDMPFASMVGLMVKWTLAAIPALIILGALGLVAAAAIALIIAGAGRG